MTVYYKKMNVYKPFLLNNVKMDVCRLLEGKFNSVFINMFIHDLRKHSNMFRPCPLSAVCIFFFLFFYF